jgi:hypothetical protein
MDDALDRRAERLARRVRIGVRLVFYPTALVLITVAWQHFHGKPARGQSTELVRWAGTTSQGRQINAITNAGRLVFVDAQLVERCSDNSLLTFHWTPSEGRFVQHGASARGRTVSTSSMTSGERTGVSTNYDNRISVRLGDEPFGYLRGSTVGRDGVSCESGPITFRLVPPGAR